MTYSDFDKLVEDFATASYNLHKANPKTEKEREEHHAATVALKGAYDRIRGDIVQKLEIRKEEAMKGAPDPQCSPYLFEYWSGRVKEIDNLIEMIETP